MSLNYSSIQKPLLCSSGSPSVNFLYGPYANMEELNNTFQDLGMDEEGAIPEYLTVLVDGTEYWYVGNAWVKKNDSKPSEDYTMNLTGRFTVSLDNDNLILDDDTSSADLALHTNQVTLYDYGANVTSNCTNWTATIPAGSNLQAAINNGVVTLSKKTEGKLVEGDYAVVITWNYTIQNEQGNSLDITMTKKQQVTIKNLNQGESYKLLANPTVLKLDYQNSAAQTIATKLLQIKNGISNEVSNYTLKYKFVSDANFTDYTYKDVWSDDIIDDKVENFILAAYINEDTLVDQQTITVMRDDNKLTLSNPIVILDDNTTNLTDIKNASITSVLFNGEEVDSGVEVYIPSPASSCFMQGREEGRRFLQLITAGEQNNNNQEDVHRLPIVDTEFDVTYTYNGYSAVQRVKIANISQGQVYSLKASPQFVAVSNQGSIEQAVNLIFSSIYRGETTSHELDSLVVEYKFDGDSNWTNIDLSEQLTLNGNILTFNNEGNNYSPRNNLYIRVSDAEGSIVYDETEIAFVKAGADGKNSDALGWRVSLDNDFFVLDDDVNSSVYTSVSTTHPKIYYNSHDVTSQFELVDNPSIVKTTSTELRVVRDNDIDYHIAVTNNNVTKLDTSSLGTTGKVLLYFVPKNILDGEDTVNITSESEVLTPVAADFTLGATASYLINDISDGFSYKLEIDPPYQNIEYTTAPTILIPPPKKITLYKVSPKGTEVVPTSQYILKYSTNDMYIPINPGDSNYNNTPSFNYIHNCLTKCDNYYDNTGAESNYTVSILNPIKFAAFTLDGETILDVEYITLNMRGQTGANGVGPSVSDVANAMHLNTLLFMGEWKEGVQYKYQQPSENNNLKITHYVSYTVPTSQTIDLDSSNPQVEYSVTYYECTSSHTSTSSKHPGAAGSPWTAIGAPSNVICGVVKAETVQANSVLIENSNQEQVAGMQAKVDDKPIIFAGCKEVPEGNSPIPIQNSPFRVYENGDVVANSLKFAGWQYMLSKEVTTTDFIDKQAQFPLGLCTYTTYIDSNDQAYMLKDITFTGNIVNPEKLGQFIIVNTNRSIYLPSFAVDYFDYYDDPNNLLSPSYVVPGIMQGSGDTFPDELFNYMAACRQLVGNKLTCIILNDAADIGQSWTNENERITLGNAGRAVGGSVFGLLSYCDVQGITIDTQFESTLPSNMDLRMVLECVQTTATNDAREIEENSNKYDIASDADGVYLELNNSGDKLYFADLVVYNQNTNVTNPWDYILNHSISFKDYSNTGIVLQLECCHDFTWNGEVKSEIVYWRVNKIAVLDNALPCMAWYYNRNEEGVFSSMQNLVSSN